MLKLPRGKLLAAALVGTVALYCLLAFSHRALLAGLADHLKVAAFVTLVCAWCLIVGNLRVHLSRKSAGVRGGTYIIGVIAIALLQGLVRAQMTDRVWHELWDTSTAFTVPFLLALAYDPPKPATLPSTTSAESSAPGERSS